MGRHNASDPFKELPKAWWLGQAIKAIIASTGPNHRFMMYREGFVAFQDRVLPAFNSINACKFDANDARTIYEGLKRWSARHEAHLQIFLERAFDETRRRSWKQADEPLGDNHNPDIETDSVKHGHASFEKGRMVR